MLVGIVCEYNPLHNGHVRHIMLTKEKYPNSNIVCVLSGCFTQRGEPSVMDKFLRAKHSILAGADMVVELPFVFATSPADEFAYGAVRWLIGLGVQVISFGSECGDITQLCQTAERISSPSPEAKEDLMRLLKTGVSYPRALSESLINVFNDHTLTSPNNLLGVQYIVKASKLNPNIEYFTVLRPNNYNDENLKDSFCSSRALRLNAAVASFVKESVPSFVWDDWKHFDGKIIEKYNEFAFNFLRLMQPSQLEQIVGIVEGMQNKLCQTDCTNFDELVTMLKSKRYTMLRIKRAILHSVFSLTKEIFAKAKDTSPYYNVLAINKEKLFLMEKITPNLKQLDENQQIMFDFDIAATNFCCALKNKKGDVDLTTPLQKV